MLELSLNMYHAAAIGALVLILGRFTLNKLPVLKRFCIPAPVVGGIIYAILHTCLYAAGIMTISFDNTLQTFFMTVFFTSVGFTASFQLLKKGGLQVVIFLIVSIILVSIQDFVGCGMAGLFDLDARLGLCVGSIPLVGGHGTSGSFGPLMEEMGIEGAYVVAIAAATYGLVSGSLMGGPLANALITKYDLHPEADAVVVEDEAVTQPVDNERFMNATLLYAIAIGAGQIVNVGFKALNITMPAYIGSMLVAAIIRNIADGMKKETPSLEIDALGNLSLSMFLALAMMGLKLWQLVELAIPMISILAVQTIIMGLYAYFICFRVMGRDYDAAVMSAGLCGFGMGATPNAIANMQAVQSKFGAAQRAFFVVPLVGALFIDFFNSTIITTFLSVLTH